MPRTSIFSSAVVLVVLSGCTLGVGLAAKSSAATTSDSDAGIQDGGFADGGLGDGGLACTGDEASLEAACVTNNSWGSALTTQFGRIDGTLTAIANPGASQCSQSNATHLILEVTMNGSLYAVAVNVTDPSNVFLGETDAPLFGDPWQEGWHVGGAEQLDYANNLNVHSPAFTPYSQRDLVSAVDCELTQGDHVSVFGLAWGPDGLHDVHRNTGGGGADGAIVLHADGARPHYLMFRFAGQTF